MSDEELERRHTTSKAVATAFLLLGVVFIALSVFVAVLLQRAC